MITLLHNTTLEIATKAIELYKTTHTDDDPLGIAQDYIISRTRIGSIERKKALSLFDHWFIIKELK